MTCPACKGPAFTANGYNPNTLKYDIPEECPHLCPVRAKAGNYEFCLCCPACMAVCRERTG